MCKVIMKKLIVVLSFVAMEFLSACADGGAAIAPKFLWEAAKPFDGEVSCDVGVTVAPSGSSMRATFDNAALQWPSFTLVPSKPWDLSPWGRVEVRLTNPGKKSLSVGLRVDNPGDWKTSPWNAENIYLKPGETKIGKVIFGYQYGFKKGYKLDPSRVCAVKVFLNGKSAEKRELVLEDFVATGIAGEKPAVNPAHRAVVPKDGVLVPMKGGKNENLSTHAGAQAAFTPSGTLFVRLGSKPGAAVRVKPAQGFWNLGTWLKVVATVRNTGTSAFRPIVKVDGNGGARTVTASAALGMGETMEVEVPFMPTEPWVLKGDAKGAKAVGGTTYESHRTKGVVFSSVETGAAFEVVSLRAEKVIAEIPATLGKVPPVPGKWVRTLSEEFNEGVLNEKVWSPYSSNYWDKRTHFSRENILFRDGCAILKYERKTGHENDDATRKTTDYACGILDSYGRWTQRYGYFEARMKLPTCPGLWPAFWTMPDRGEAAGKERWMRSATEKDGMEFDIMEHLTAWGPHRFNVACHWDGYGKNHRAIGTSGIYVPADKDGFITVGMLWLPGVFAVYGNGIELARWESERVASVPAYIFFYMVSGGWANDPLDDDQLPDEFAIDWFRAWQREDLITK